MPAEGCGRSNVFREQPGVFKPGGHDGRTGKGTVEGWKGGRCIECIGIRVQERNDDLGNLTSVAVSACPGSFLPSALVPSLSRKVDLLFRSCPTGRTFLLWSPTAMSLRQSCL